MERLRFATKTGRRRVVAKRSSAGHCRVFSLALAVLLSVAFVSASAPAGAQGDIPEVVRELLDDGDRHRAAGRLDEAILSYREARRLDASVLEIYTSLGAVHVGRGELDQALEVFASGLDAQPDDRQLLFNSGVVALRLDRHELALGFVERALRVYRGDPELHSLHGAVLSRLGRYDEALAATEIAADTKPGDPQILFRLGNLQHQLNRDDAAIESFRKAIKKDRDMLRAYYNLGAVLMGAGRFEEARDAYLVALEPFDKAFAAGQSVDSTHALAYQNLGAIYLRREEWKPALDAYGKALRLDPEASSVLYNQGFIYFSLRQLSAAEDAYKQALALDPDLPVAYLHLGQIHQQRGELEEAIRWLTDGLPRFDAEDRLTAWRALAESEVSLGHPQEAERAYREVLEAAPKDLPSRLALGRLLRREGRPHEARQELERARAAEPDNREISVELAVLARVEGRTADEQKLYEDVLRSGGSRKDLWPVRLSLAVLHLRQGELEKARPHFEILDRETSSSRSGRKSAAKNQSEAGPGDEATQLIATLHGLLLALDGDRVAARKRLRGVLTEDGDFAAASEVSAVLEAMEGKSSSIAELTKVYDRHRSGRLESVTRANLGLALWSMGRSDEAQEHLEVAAAVLPRWVSLRAALGHIALENARYEAAVTELVAASSLCREPLPLGGQALSVGGSPEGVFQTAIGGDAGCKEVERNLGLAKIHTAYAGLQAAVRGSGSLTEVRRLAGDALKVDMGPVLKAVAHFVRGTAALAQGSYESAGRDLGSALAGALPEALQALALNNQAVAQARLGRFDSADELFAAARSSRNLSGEATLNLGILLDDHLGKPRQALELYREYAAKKGRRQSEVETWIERLERVYR